MVKKWRIYLKQFSCFTVLTYSYTYNFTKVIIVSIRMCSFMFVQTNTMKMYFCFTSDQPRRLKYYNRRVQIPMVGLTSPNVATLTLLKTAGSLKPNRESAQIENLHIFRTLEYSICFELCTFIGDSKWDEAITRNLKKMYALIRWWYSTYTVIY